METVAKILWIDDDKKDVENWIPIIEPYGCKIENAKNGLEGIAKIERGRYDKVLVDLNMPEMDGIDFLQYLTKNHPYIPATIISAHLDEPLWKNRIKTIEQPIQSIESPLPMEGSPKFKKAIKAIFSGIEFDSLNCPNFEEYKKLDIEKINKIKEAVYQYNKNWIEKKIFDLKADWILVSNFGLIEYSENSEDFPDEDYLEAYGNKTNEVPFIFFRTPIIEEIPWNHIPPNDDYYPTLEVKILGKENEILCIGDFDTGAETSCMDFDFLKSNQIVSDGMFDIFHDSLHLNKKYKCIKKKLNIGIVSSCNSMEIRKMPCILVKNWINGPFTLVNKNRKALFGRDILKRAKFCIELDSDKKITKITKIVFDNMSLN